MSKVNKKEKDIEEKKVNVDVDLMVEDNESDLLIDDEVNHNKKSKSKNVVIAILVAVLAFLIVYASITVITDVLNDKESEVIEEKDDGENEVVDDSENDIEDIDTNNQNNDGNTSNDNNQTNDNVTDGNIEIVEGVIGENGITLTENMKSEVLAIAAISNNRQGYCLVPYLFMNNSGYLTNFDLSQKRSIVEYYAIVNKYSSVVDSYSAITEENYNIVANKYGFSESFDEMFSGYEKKDNMYIFPPNGCVGPEYLVHDLSYESYNNMVILIDNVSIVDSSINSKVNVKVTYTFSYENSSFKLLQVNSER